MAQNDQLFSEQSKQLVFYAINAYREEDRVAHFSLDNLSEIRLSTLSASKVVKELVKDGLIEDRTEPGFCKQVYIYNPVDCPDFVFHNDLTYFQRGFLLECYLKLDSFKRKSYTELSTAMNITPKQASHLIGDIRKNTNTSMFELLEYSINTVKKVHHNKYALVKTVYGYQIDSYGVCSGNLQLTGKEKDHAKQKRMASKLSIGTFLFKKIKCSARRTYGDLSIEVDAEYLENLYNEQDGKCYYTGVELTKSNMSVDRINNDLDYIEGNLVLTTSEINMFRRKWSLERFVELCTQVSEYRGKLMSSSID